MPVYGAGSNSAITQSLRKNDETTVHTAIRNGALAAGDVGAYDRVKLRVQNANDSPVEYDGMSLQLELNGEPFASGVSDQRGVVPRFGETLIEAPVIVPAFAVVRQAFAFGNSEHASECPRAAPPRLSLGESRINEAVHYVGDSLARGDV
jgi:Late embryogenesis abundant protein